MKAYDQNHKLHTLKISGPHDQNKVEESIQKLLSEMEEVVSQRMNQMFHDVFRLFNRHSIREHIIEINSSEKISAKFLKPIPKIASDLPVNFAPRYETEVTSFHIENSP